MHNLNPTRRDAVRISTTHNHPSKIQHKVPRGIAGEKDSAIRRPCHVENTRSCRGANLRSSYLVLSSIEAVAVDLGKRERTKNANQTIVINARLLKLQIDRALTVVELQAAKERRRCCDANRGSHPVAGWTTWPQCPIEYLCCTTSFATEDLQKEDGI